MQRTDDAYCDRHRGHARGGGGCPRRGSAGELVRDGGLHALDLLGEQGRVLAGSAARFAHRVLQDRQRRLQTVREIFHRPPIALPSGLLVGDEAVEIARQAGELAWVVRADVRARSRFQAAYALGHGAQRPQPPMQRGQLNADEHQPNEREADRGAAPERGDLRPVRRLGGEHPEGQLLAQGFPDDGVGDHVARRFAGRFGDVEAKLARSRALVQRRLFDSAAGAAHHGRRAPDDFAEAVVHVGDKAGVGAAQARFADFVREGEPAAALLRCAQQAEDHRLQMVFRAGAQRRVEGAVQHPADGAEAGHQHQRCDEREAGLETEAQRRPGTGHGHIGSTANR